MFLCGVQNANRWASTQDFSRTPVGLSRHNGAAGGLFIGVALWALMNDDVDVPVLRAIRGAIAEEGFRGSGQPSEGFVILNDVACPVGNIDLYRCALRACLW